MTADEFNTLGARLFGPRYISRIAGRLAVDERTVRAWSEGTRPIAPATAERLTRLAASCDGAPPLVERFLTALFARAEADAIERADIITALARRSEVQAACASLRDANRQPLGRGR